MFSQALVYFTKMHVSYSRFSIQIAFIHRFAFIHFGDPALCKKAVETANNRSLAGNKLSVSYGKKVKVKQQARSQEIGKVSFI